jgi:lipopolysaccharide export system permease protein
VNILFRYLSREFIKLVAMCLVSLILVYLLFDFIDRAGTFFRTAPSFLHVALYFVYKIPLIFFQVMPVSVLLGALLVLAIMSRHSEITAMKAGGISVARVVTPILLWSVVLAGVAFAVNEYVVPVANTKMKYVQTVYIKKQDWRARLRANDLWYKSPGAIYHVAKFNPDIGRLDGLMVFRFDDDFNLTERVDAARAQWADNRWTAYEGVQRRFGNGVLVAEKAFAAQPLAFPETPEQLKVYKRDPEQMSYRELAAYIHELRQEGYDVRRYQVDLHAKISFALVTIIMAVLGIPWAIRSGRQGGIAFGIGVAVVIGVGYWIVLGFSLALGRAAALPVSVAVWGPHVLFGVLGLAGILRVRS